MLPNYKNGKTYCLCDCDCGNECEILSTNLRYNPLHTSSCGCSKSYKDRQEYEDKSYKVYKYTSPSNKYYIGITNTSLQARSGRNGINYKQSSKFWRAIQKYGWENFKREILEDNIPTIEKAWEREQYYVSLYDSYKNGYNLTIGGYDERFMASVTKKARREKGYHLTQEHKQHISEAHRERVKNVLQYDKDGSYIKTYSSISEASKDIGCSPNLIRNNLLKKCDHAYGYIWRYEGDDDIVPLNRDVRTKHFKDSVSQFDLSNKLIGVYESVQEAGRLTGINPTVISCVCHKRKNYKTAGGYIWRYTNEYSEEEVTKTIEEIKNPTNKRKRVIQYSKDGDYIAEFKSITIASQNTGIGGSSITQNCQGKQKTAGGYIWKYAD